MQSVKRRSLYEIYIARALGKTLVDNTDHIANTRFTKILWRGRFWSYFYGEASSPYAYKSYSTGN